jgi:hypothetical protein
MSIRYPTPTYECHTGHTQATFSFWRNSPLQARAASFLRFLDHTQWHTTVGRTLWTSDQLIAAHLITNKTFTRGVHPCSLRDSNPQSQHDPRLRSLGHWKRHLTWYYNTYVCRKCKNTLALPSLVYQRKYHSESFTYNPTHTHTRARARARTHTHTGFVPC